MSLKNVLIVVGNIDESIDFYEELFGLNKKARRSSHKNHMKGCTMSGEPWL